MLRFEGSYIIVPLGGIDLIFPFSENWPANYNFSLFSKLPTNYPKIPEKYNLHTNIYRFAVCLHMFLVFFLKYLKEFVGNFENREIL